MFHFRTLYTSCVVDLPSGFVPSKSVYGHKKDLDAQSAPSSMSLENANIGIEVNSSRFIFGPGDKWYADCILELHSDEDVKLNAIILRLDYDWILD